MRKGRIWTDQEVMEICYKIVPRLGAEARKGWVLDHTHPLMVAVLAALKASTFSDAVDAMSETDLGDPDGAAMIVRGATLCPNCNGDGAIDKVTSPEDPMSLLDAAKWALRGLESLAEKEAERTGSTSELCDYTFAKGLRNALKRVEEVEASGV